MNPRIPLLALALLLAAPSLRAELLGSAITYQGELRVAGLPAEGEFDFQFELFDAASNGVLVGSPVLVEDVPVANGVFSIELDFGFAAFDGDARWLEIGVRDGASSGGYQGLAPRQAVTAAPYALHAVKAEMVESTPVHDHIGEHWFGEAEFWMLELSNTATPTAGTSPGGLRAASSSAFTTIYSVNNPTDGTGAGVYGATNGTGPGLKGYSRLGAALHVNSFSAGNIIEAYSGHPDSANLRFRVSSAGNVTADGTFTGGGADVAEFIDHHGKLEPGDVVAIAKDGRFARVDQAGSTAVAGVVTTHPGLLMNAAEGRRTLQDGPAMALAGRVPVKVTDEGGPIRPGDLLIAAATPGHAMRAPAEPRPGTVIGKALGRHEAARGTVEMLVMLR